MSSECRILGVRIQFRVPVEITVKVSSIQTNIDVIALKVETVKRIRDPCNLYLFYISLFHEIDDII